MAGNIIETKKSINAREGFDKTVNDLVNGKDNDKSPQFAVAGKIVDALVGLKSNLKLTGLEQTAALVNENMEYGKGPKGIV